MLDLRRERAPEVQVHAVVSGGDDCVCEDAELVGVPEEYLGEHGGGIVGQGYGLEVACARRTLLDAQERRAVCVDATEHPGMQRAPFGAGISLQRG